jgi:hypothetical protein
VADAIRQGRADAGLAIEAVAREQGLDFLPLIWERYDLVVRRMEYFEPPLQHLFAFTRTDLFRERARSLGGVRRCQYGRRDFQFPPIATRVGAAQPERCRRRRQSASPDAKRHLGWQLRPPSESAVPGYGWAVRPCSWKLLLAAFHEHSSDLSPPRQVFACERSRLRQAQERRCRGRCCGEGVAGAAQGDPAVPPGPIPMRECSLALGEKNLENTGGETWPRG